MVYCVKRPIVQSKDCTDTGRVRDPQRPELGDGGVVPCSLWPPVTRAGAGAGRIERLPPHPLPPHWVTGSRAISNDQGEHSRRPSTPCSKPLKCMRSPRLASAVSEPSVSSSSLATLLPLLLQAPAANWAWTRLFQGRRHGRAPLPGCLKGQPTAPCWVTHEGSVTWWPLGTMGSTETGLERGARGRWGLWPGPAALEMGGSWESSPRG